MDEKNAVAVGELLRTRYTPILMLFSVSFLQACPWELEAFFLAIEENGVAVLAANICYDGTDGRHEEGGNAFTPYIIKTISANGNEHKIGILGLDNPDTKRIEPPDMYPGLMFSHPENTNDSIAYEAGLYIPKMIEEGCEFIITAYHGGLGNSDGELIIGGNTEHQGQRLVEESEDISRNLPS